VYSYLLPIGSVVQLKGAEKCVMIFGILQKNAVSENEVKTIDYIGVPYPAGYINNMINIGFNNEQIEKVVFKGYENGDEWTNFKHALELAEKINEKKNEIEES